MDHAGVDESLEAALFEARLALEQARRIAGLGGFERNFLDPSRCRWSKETFDIFGLDPSRGPLPLGELIDLFVHPDDREKLRQAMERGRREGRNYDIVFRILRVDGALRYVRSVASMIRGSSGKVEKLVGTVQDVTELRELEKKLAQNRALAAVGSMAAVVAHEIRNPLGSIVMAGKALARAGLSDGDRRTISSVLSAESERLQRTLQEFLEYVRPQEPRLEISDFNGQVEEIIGVLTSQKDVLRGIRIEVSLAKKLPPFPYDPDQIRQVLWNLLLNGIEAMNGNGRLEVSTSLGWGQAVFCVVDSGPGIDPQCLDKIFEPFFTTKKKGTGLGLAVARRIVEAHGGRILAGNAPRGGARFQVFFPMPTSL